MITAPAAFFVGHGLRSTFRLLGPAQVAQNVLAWTPRGCVTVDRATLQLLPPAERARFEEQTVYDKDTNAYTPHYFSRLECGSPPDAPRRPGAGDPTGPTRDRGVAPES